MIYQSKIEAIPFFYNPERKGRKTKSWIQEQPRNTWIPILSIPNEIFFSVWNDWIETNKCELHLEKPQFKILIKY